MHLTTTKPAGRRFVLKTLPILLAALLWQPSAAMAQSGHDLGAASDVTPRPLQELVRKKREKGLIYVTIPQAREYGEGSGYRAYCSPQIRAINTSHKTVQDMIVGIRYLARGRKDVGSTVTRFSRVKVGKQETHYFYSTIDAGHCHGLTGEMEIIRCVYDNGVDCTEDVRTVAYGAVPMVIVGKNKESK